MDDKTRKEAQRIGIELLVSLNKIPGFDKLDHEDSDWVLLELVSTVMRNVEQEIERLMVSNEIRDKEAKKYSDGICELSASITARAAYKRGWDSLNQFLHQKR